MSTLTYQYNVTSTYYDYLWHDKDMLDKVHAIQLFNGHPTKVNSPKTTKLTRVRSDLT